MTILATLTLRTLSLVRKEPFVGKCLDLLQRIRGVTISWARNMIREADENSESDQASSLGPRILRVATTCRLTYDVDPEYIARTLNDPDALCIFLESLIYVHDHSPPDIKRLSFDLRRRIWGDRRIAHKLENDV